MTSNWIKVILCLSTVKVKLQTKTVKVIYGFSLYKHIGVQKKSLYKH